LKAANNNSKVKRTPERKCIGCNESKKKAELIRVVRASDGTVFLDFNGKKPGRGAYICKDIKCFRNARKAKRFESSLSCVIPDEVYGQLEEELINNENGN